MAEPNGVPNATLIAFSFDGALEPWAVSKHEWLRVNAKSFDGLATAALIFDARGRVLLVQRAEHDSMPGKWEVPGGAVDAEDETILHGCVRETREEAGLKIRHVKRLVTEGGGGQGHHSKQQWSVFTNSKGTKIICSFAFEVEVEVEETDAGNEAVVTIDPNEHQDWAWVTEQEVRAGLTEEGKKIPLSAPMVRNRLMEAFRMRREDETGQIAIPATKDSSNSL